MGKNKQSKENRQVKEKKFDRNVEISAPILDPEIIKAIHTPPKDRRLDIRHGGFKALLSDLNSQDSTDELTPLNDNHVPSYIGISCAVSGYSNYSSYSKRPNSLASNRATSTPNRSRATSPAAIKKIDPEVHHITIDKNNIHSVDEERKELTEKLTASAYERKRSPSPCIPPTEDDRHHGAYVGARYCPLPPPSNLVNKHIPLLGIDDDQNPDEALEEAEHQKKVEQRIASLYGDNFVEDWRESMTHKAKKEINREDGTTDQLALKSPKDLVTLKPTPQVVPDERHDDTEVEIPNKKVLVNVEKGFLNKLLTDDNPPMPSPSPTLLASPTRDVNETITNSSPQPPSPLSPPPPPPVEAEPQQTFEQEHQVVSPPLSPSPIQNQNSPDMMNLDAEEQLTIEDRGLIIPPQQTTEEHIEYEIRAQSPIDNNSSPVKIPHHQIPEDLDYPESKLNDQQEMLSLSQESLKARKIVDDQEGEEVAAADENENNLAPTSDNIKNGLYYLDLLNTEKSFIAQEVARAEEILKNQEAALDDDTVGRIRSAIGKANLLVNKKCKQFEGLCESNLNKDANDQYATLNEDLAGFWDMLSIQVVDVRKSFETLWQVQESNWREGDELEQQDHEDDPRGSNMKDSKIVSKPKLSSQKDQERRERLQEHINQMKQNQAAKSSNENLLDGTTQSEIDEIPSETLVIENKIQDRLESPTNFLGEPALETTSTVEEDEEQMISLIGGLPEESLESNVKQSSLDTNETNKTPETETTTNNQESVNDLVDLLD